MSLLRVWLLAIGMVDVGFAMVPPHDAFDIVLIVIGSAVIVQAFRIGSVA